MKRLATLLVASLLLNAAWFTFAPRDAAGSNGPASAPPNTAQTTAALSVQNARGKSNRAAADSAVVPGSRWDELRSDDLEVLVARLRAAGLPRDVVLGILNLALNERYAGREREIYPQDPNAPFWKASFTTFSPERDLAASKLWRERDELKRKLLGADYFTEGDGMLTFYRRQFGDTSPEKIVRAQQLFASYGAMRREIQPLGQNPSPENREKLIMLDHKLRADLAGLLTPQELERYDLRSSETAQQLRHGLRNFEVSEAEYVALYRLHQPIDEQYSQRYGALSADQQAARTRAEEQAQEQIKALLGPDRYADYQQASDPEHQQLNQIVKRLGLPLSAARAVADVQKGVTQRAEVIRANASLDPAQRNAQLAALAREAETKVGGLLGARGLETYRQYRGGWLSGIARGPQGAEPVHP